MRRAAALACVAVLAACSRDPRRALPGEWRSGTARMVFYHDGQVLMQEGDSTASEARYEWVDRGRLRIRALAAAPADYAVTVTGDSLILCRVDDAAQCYRLARGRGGE